MGWVDDIERALNNVLPKPVFEGKDPALTAIERTNQLIRNIQADNDAKLTIPGYVPPSESEAQSVLIPITMSSGSSPSRVNLPPGRGLIFLREGCPPGIRLDVTLGSQTYTNISPGTKITGQWVNGYITPRVTTSSPTFITFYVLVVNHATIEEPNRSEGYGGYVDESVYLQATNSTANTPSVATVGFSIEGVRGLQAFIVADYNYATTGGTFSGGGSARLWKLSPSVNLDPDLTWGLVSATAMTAFTGRAVACIEFTNLVPFGGYYVDLLSVTASAGTQMAIYLRKWV